MLTLLCVSMKNSHEVTFCSSLFALSIDDHNRIALNPLPENSEWSGDYINACYIDVSQLQLEIQIVFYYIYVLYL